MLPAQHDVQHPPPEIDASGYYWDAASREVARVLSIVDRERLSKTYGCFDRVHWCWKFTDFPGARFQEGVFTLAWLYTSPLSGDFCRNPRVLEWLAAGLSYWIDIQYPDGSFDEAYPYEHSLAATAFTAFYVGEAFLRVREDLDTELRDKCVRAFGAAGVWLCQNDEKHGVLSNHLAAAAAGLHNIARITEDKRFYDRSDYFVGRILEKQSPEGWYEEYGGADPGYQTHATFYLAWLWEKTRSETLFSSLARAVDFQRYTIHPNGTLGGEYGSRGTEFYYPAGFEILAPYLPEAASIAGALRPASLTQQICGPATMDSYNLFPVLNNYLFAAEAAGALPPTAPLPSADRGEWSFSDAGILFKSTDAYYAVMSASKGGVIRVYDRRSGTFSLSDAGYWAETKGSIVSSQSLDRGNRWQRSGHCEEVTASFAAVNQRTLQPMTFIGFRLFTVILGRWQRIAYGVKQLLVRTLVSRRKPYPLTLTRKVVFHDDRISIHDRITPQKGARISSLTATPKFLTIHMGSSRYFQQQELALPAESPLSDAVDRLNGGQTFERTTTWRPQPNEVFQ